MGEYTYTPFKSLTRSIRDEAIVGKIVSEQAWWVKTASYPGFSSRQLPTSRLESQPQAGLEEQIVQML
jgi:hypothetical protein